MDSSRFHTVITFIFWLFQRPLRRNHSRITLVRAERGCARSASRSTWVWGGGLNFRRAGRLQSAATGRTQSRSRSAAVCASTSRSTRDHAAAGPAFARHSRAPVIQGAGSFHSDYQVLERLQVSQVGAAESQYFLTIQWTLLPGASHPKPPTNRLPEASAAMECGSADPPATY